MKDKKRKQKLTDAMAREDLIIGRNAVTEVLKSQRQVEKLMISASNEGSIKKIMSMAKDKGIVVISCEKSALDRLSNGENHQGVVAFVTEFQYSDTEDILNLARERGEEPFLLILDGITDPHNLGAIMRTAECVGIHGIIIPKRRSVGVNQTVVKTSTGASEYVKVAKVGNIAATIDELKDRGLWIYSANMDGEPYTEHNYSGGIGLVIGAEGRGVSVGVQKKCDFTISIPMRGKINSLNASNATAIIAYEIANQKFFNI